MQATIVTIGDELLIGQVIDTNSAWIASELEKMNIKVREIRSIQDTKDVIIRTLEELTKVSDVIILTGGLGPTKDDVTKHAIAEYLNDELVFNEESYKQLTALFEQIQKPVRDHHMGQCYVPSSCTVLPNLMGTAQGMWMEKENTIIISTPGVPYEMKYIFENGGFRKLSQLQNGNRIVHRTIMTIGKGETDIEQSIQQIVKEYEAKAKVAYLPSLGKVRVRITSTGADAESIVKEVCDRIVKELNEIVYGYDDEPLEQIIGNLLKEKSLTLGTAESCTGGFLAHLITSISGSSAYYEGSVIAYSNDVKMKILGVHEQTLKEHGAVSEQTVKEMVSGVVDHLGVDIGIATSGIAGPTGGTKEKPVGTVWLACGNKDRMITELLHLSKDRMKNIEYSAYASLNMVRKFLSGQ